jgi:hypothetical protein
MIQHEKRKAVVGVPLGLVLCGAALYLALQELIPAPFCLLVAFGGICVYIWGCAALANAKGYSTAIVLTVILGVVFPAVVLLVLPDKNKIHKRRSRGEP